MRFLPRPRTASCSLQLPREAALYQREPAGVGAAGDKRDLFQVQRTPPLSGISQYNTAVIPRSALHWLGLLAPPLSLTSGLDTTRHITYRCWHRHSSIPGFSAPEPSLAEYFLYLYPNPAPAPPLPRGG